MAEVMTYDSLVSDMKSYQEREYSSDKFVDQIPRLIMMAENRLATELKILGFQTVVTGTFQPGQITLPKPAYWRDVISFNITTGSGATAQRVELLPRSYEYCRNYWPNPTQTGTPRFYADYNYENFLIVPTPSTNLTFELLYHARLQPLDPSNQTNWLTVNAPQLLLYAAMLEGQTFLKNAEGAATWQALYDRALAAFNGEDAMRKTDRTTING